MIVGNASSAAAQIAHHTIPEPGQLVEARRRQWIVSEVDGGSTAPGAGNGPGLTKVPVGRGRPGPVATYPLEAGR